MTELLLIFAIAAGGVAFSTTVVRWILVRPMGDEEIVRAAAMVGGGLTRYLRRQNAVALAVAGVMAAVVLLAYGVGYQLEAVRGVSPRYYGLWSSGSYLLGAVAGLGAGWVASWSARQACVRVAEGARRSLDDSLQIGLRAGAVTGVVTSALSLLSLAALFALAEVLAGGMGSKGLALAAAPGVPRLLVGFGLGTGFVALTTHIGGGIFGNVADIGADVAGKLEGSLPEDSPHNPATVADLVGDQVGDGTTRAVSLLAAVAAESTAAMLVAAAVYGENEDLPSVTAFVLFPLVARSFSIIASWFGVMVVRTDDTEVPMNAVARGLHVTTLLHVVGAVGCAKWLLGPHWTSLGVCAALGSIGSLATLYVAQYISEQKHRPVRSIAETARGGPTLATLRGLVAGAQGTAAQLVVLLIVAVSAFVVGERTELEGGGLLGLSVAVGGLLGAAPYVLAMDCLGSIADVAGGIIEMTVAAERPDVRARARLLDTVGTTAKSYTKSLLATSTLLTSGIFLAMVLREVWGSDESAGIVAWWLVGGALGLISILAFAAVLLSRVVSASRDVVHELRVMLASGLDDARPSTRPSTARLGGLDAKRDLPGDGDGAGQLACVEIVSRIALRSIIAPTVVGVGLPVLAGAALRIASREDRVAASAEAIVALLFVATIVAALVSLLFTHAGAAWDNAKKYIDTGAHGGRFVIDTTVPAGSSRAGSTERPGGEVDNPTYVAAVIGDTIGDPLKGAIGPTVQALVTTLVALAFVFLPFFL